MLCRLPRQHAVTLLYSMGFLLLGLNVASVGPLLVALTTQVGVPLADGGALFSSRATGYFCGSILTSLVDRWPAQGNRVIAVGLLLAGGLTAIVPLTQSLVAMCACLFFVGVSMGTLDTGANVMLLQEFSARQLRADSAMQTLHAAFAVGAFVSPLWMHYVSKSFGHAAAIWSMAATFPVVAVALLAVLGTPTLRLKLDGDAGANADDDEAQAAERTRQKRVQRLELAVVAAGAIFLGLYVGCEVGAGGFVDVFAQFVGFSDDESAVLNSGLWLTFALARIAAIFVAAKLAPITIMIGSLSLGVSALLVPLVFGTTRAPVWLGFLLFGAAMAPCFPTCFTYCDRVMSKGLSASRAAALAVGAAAGEFAIPWTLGQVMASTDFGSLTWLLEVGMVLATLAFVAVVLIARVLHPGTRWGLPQSVERKSEPDTDGTRNEGSVPLLEMETDVPNSEE